MRDHYIVTKEMSWMAGVYDKNARLLTRVLDNDEDFLVNMTPVEILDETLNFYGFDLRGALNGAKKVHGNVKMSPFIVIPSHAVCLFPTKSPSRHDCIFINVQHILNTLPRDRSTKIQFISGRSLIIPSRYGQFIQKKDKAEQLQRIIAARNEGKFETSYHKREYFYCRETGLLTITREDRDKDDEEDRNSNSENGKSKDKKRKKKKDQ